MWSALLRVPPGRVVSYLDLASAIGQPRAVRAVAGALAHNPVGYLVPCHRVIRATGALGDYRWGAPAARAARLGERAGRGGRLKPRWRRRGGRDLLHGLAVQLEIEAVALDLR